MRSTRNDGGAEYRGSQPRNTRELSEWHALSPIADALEPDLPIVDAHHHLFGASTDSHFYRLDDLHRDVDSGHRVIGTVYVEAYSSGWRTTGPEALRPVGEVDMIVGLTGAPLQTRHGSCQVAAAIVSNADLTLGDDVVELLEQSVAAGEGRLRGVRHRTATDDGTVGSFIADRPRPHLLLDPAFRRGFAHLDRFGLSFDAWIYHTQLDELVDLADAFPNTTMILNHVGAPIGVAEFKPKRAAVLERWEKGVRALAARANVNVKVGGMGMTMFGFDFERAARPAASSELVRAWQPYIDLCLEAFGAKRCMFESNFPVDKQSCTYTELWNAFKLATRGLSPDERSELFHRTACRTYRLPQLARGESSV
jgi:predicted TIM-barrel fold metal-dependent hydrolase